MVHLENADAADDPFVQPILYHIIYIIVLYDIIISYNSYYRENDGADAADDPFVLPRNPDIMPRAPCRPV
jgi:hypothetical protein